MLRAAHDLADDVDLLHLVVQRVDHFAQVLLALGARLGDHAADLLVLVGLEVVEGKVLKLPLHRVDAQTVRDGGVDFERFARLALTAPHRTRRTVSYQLELDSRPAWEQAVGTGLDAIKEGRVEKVVLSRRLKLRADEPFSSKDLLVNLIDGSARGTVFLYRYGDVFFCGCTPELLLRKKGTHVESMCLAGTCPHGETPEEQKALADELLGSEKNRREHEYVVKFMREVFARNCYNVDIPTTPQIKVLKHVQHLHTPAAAQVMEGTTLMGLASQLHPTPALSGTPVGEALMTLREAEGYNRGFFGGAVGYVNADGDGEFSVAIRSGVFDGERGWLYAGCGIVEGSDAAAEFNEIDLKLKTILSAFEAPEDEGDE